jgi:hypothetical protein
MRNSLILDPYFTISPTVPSAARQLRSQPQPRLQRQRSLRDLSTTLLRLREAASDHAGIQGLPRRACVEAELQAPRGSGQYVDDMADRGAP